MMSASLSHTDAQGPATRRSPVAAHLIELAWMLGAAVAIAGCWRTLITLAPHWFSLDLYPTYVAARVWMQGHPDAVYHPALWIPGNAGHPAWVAEVRKLGVPAGDGTSFVYGPTYLLMALPLARWLSLPQVAVLVYAANALATAFIGSESLRLAGVRRMAPRALGGVLAGLTFPVISAAWLGQNTLLALALVLLGYRALHRRTWLGVTFWVLAACFKPWIVLLLAVLPLMGRWRAFGGGVLAWLALDVGLPHAVCPPAILDGYRAVLARLARITVVADNNVSLRGLLARLADPTWVRSIKIWHATEVTPRDLHLEVAIAAAVALGALALIVRRRPPDDVVFAACTALALFPLGVCWSHYLAFTLPATTVAALRPGVSRPTRAVGIAGLVWLFAMRTHAMPDLLHEGVFVPRPEEAAEMPDYWAAFYFFPTVVYLSVVFALLGGARGDCPGRVVAWFNRRAGVPANATP